MPICCAGVEGAAAQGHTGEASTLGRGEAIQPAGSTAVAHRAAGADTFAATQTHGGEDDGGRRCLEMMEQECLLAAVVGSVMEFRLCWTFNSAGEFGGGGETGAQSRKEEGGAGGRCHISGLSPGDKCSEQIFDLRP